MAITTQLIGRLGGGVPQWVWRTGSAQPPSLRIGYVRVFKEDNKTYSAYTWANYRPPKQWEAYLDIKTP